MCFKVVSRNIAEKVTFPSHWVKDRRKMSSKVTRRFSMSH